MNKLANGYSVEVDSVDRENWHNILDNFNDANIYQTWDYNEVRSGKNNISQLILKKNSAIIAATQVRIFKLPIINIGIAYVFWGPLWQPDGIKPEAEFFCQTIRALRNEYVFRRGLALRIFPVLFSNEDEHYLSVLKEEGFSLHEKGKRSRTLLINLTPSLDDLRKGLEQKWRNCLNRAVKNRLEIIEGHDDKLFEEFTTIYKEMLDRKQFAESNDINEFRTIQKMLPEHLKMKILLCKFEGEIVTGAIFSAIGKTGVYIFGATNDHGMKSNGSYLIQWKFIEWLKENNYIHFDLNGINPENNPGTYKFKAGLCGKNGKDVTFLGQFDAYKNQLQCSAIKYAEATVANIRKVKQSKANWHNPKTNKY
jgi:hypothetical protein